MLLYVWCDRRPTCRKALWWLIYCFAWSKLSKRTDTSDLREILIRLILSTRLSLISLFTPSLDRFFVHSLFFTYFVFTILLRTLQTIQFSIDQSSSAKLIAMEQPSATYQAPQQMTAEKNGLSPMGSDMNLKSHQHGSRYGNKWLFGFFDCCSPLPTCCLATWCPCILFGKTYAREHGESDTSGCNWMVS